MWPWPMNIGERLLASLLRVAADGLLLDSISAWSSFRGAHTKNFHYYAKWR